MGTAISKINKELKHHEEIISDGMKQFTFVGNSLRAIRDEKLYREDFPTFEAYCKSRWNISRPRAYQLIDSAEVVENLSTIVDKSKSSLPSNESQARALVQCADDHESRAKVWNAVVKESGDKPITAAAISKKADEILPPKTDTPKPKKEEPVAEAPKVDKRTVFDPSTFDPAMKDEEETPVSSSKNRDDFYKKLTVASHSLNAFADSLGPLVRSLDECNAEKPLNSHKAMMGHYHRIHHEIHEARQALMELVRVWRSATHGG